MQARKGFCYKGITSMHSHRGVFILFLNLFHKPNNNYCLFFFVKLIIIITNF